MSEDDPFPLAPIPLVPGTATDMADLADLAICDALGRARQAVRKRPVIQVEAGNLHNIATEAEAALVRAGSPFYNRGGLVQPVLDEVPAAKGRRTKAARLKVVSESAVVDHLSRVADFQKWDGRKKANVRTDPPAQVARVLLSRDGEWRFRALAGVITTPTLRPDGSILSELGYDPDTQLLLLDPPLLPKIPKRPSRSDAAQALALLNDLLTEFPFVDAPSRAVALSGILTPIVRGAMDVAPMHVADAPAPGSGKSFLVDVWSTPATGERAPVISSSQSEEELEKRLGAALLAGQPIVSIDNVNGNLGGDALCQLIERPVVQVRTLGQSKLVKIASRATTFATGNNIRLLGDMTRRVVVCSLDPNMERPELREFKADPLATIMADRGRYIAAALTISRAYAVAGFPGEARPLASFEQWSRYVRSALIWLGCADPVETMERARADDPVTAPLRGLLPIWHSTLGERALLVSEVKSAADQRNPHGDRAHPALHDALVEAAGDRANAVDSVRLGKFLSRWEGRIMDGMKLIKAGADGHRGQALWRVVRQ